MKQLPISFSKVCLFVRMSLYHLHVPSNFGGRAGSNASICQVFLQCVLAAVTFVGSVTRDGGARARSRCELGFLLCSLANITGVGVGVGHLRFGSKLTLFLLVCALPTPSIGSYTPEGSCAQARGPGVGTQHVSGHGL